MRSFFLRAICVLILSAGALPQQSTQAPPAIPTTGFPGLDQYRASRIAVFTDDFGQLARYRDADAALGAPKAGEKRVVFFGDSITDIWKLEDYFPGKPYINRGIGGQTTPQMLVRFRQDVINLQPKVVVILAGTNDIAGNTGPMRNEDIEANFASFAELAKVHGIRVVYSSILPVHDYTDRAKDFFAQRPQTRILALDDWLKDYCAKNGIIYLDYFSAMVDNKGMLKKDLADDGLHPNAAGFKIMAPLAEAAIQKALAAPPAH
jgi:lysophospholipase L1-like esterase